LEQILHVTDFRNFRQDFTRVCILQANVEPVPAQNESPAITIWRQKIFYRRRPLAANARVTAFNREDPSKSRAALRTLSLLTRSDHFQLALGDTEVLV
jgi:hypothetical protein